MNRDKAQRRQKVIKFNAKNIADRGFKDYNEFFSQTHSQQGIRQKTDSLKQKNTTNLLENIKQEECLQ